MTEANLMAAFLKDTESLAPSDLELMEITELAEKQLFLESRIKEIKDILEQHEENLRLVQEQYIPEAMAGIGMKKFTLSNGYSITIKEDVFASIRKDFVGQAVMWLDANGLGDIVKDQVTTNFGRGDTDKAKELLDFCKEHGFNADEKLSVHPQTLKATVKEQLSKGIEFPIEFFSIGPINKAIIKK